MGRAVRLGRYLSMSTCARTSLEKGMKRRYRENLTIKTISSCHILI